MKRQTSSYELQFPPFLKAVKEETRQSEVSAGKESDVTEAVLIGLANLESAK